MSQVGDRIVFGSKVSDSIPGLALYNLQHLVGPEEDRSHQNARVPAVSCFLSQYNPNPYNELIGPLQQLNWLERELAGLCNKVGCHNRVKQAVLETTTDRDMFSLLHGKDVHQVVDVPSLFPSLISCVYVYIYLCQRNSAHQLIILQSHLKQGGE